VVQFGSDDPCPFCQKVIAAQQRTAFDVPLADLGDLLVVPALGMFLPGCRSSWATSTPAAMSSVAEYCRNECSRVDRSLSRWARRRNRCSRA